MWAFFEFDAFHTSEWPIIWTIRWATQLHAIYKVWWWSAEYFLSTMLIKHQLTCICIVLKLKLVFMTCGQLLTPQNDSHLIDINHNNYYTKLWVLRTAVSCSRLFVLMTVVLVSGLLPAAFGFSLKRPDSLFLLPKTTHWVLEWPDMPYQRKLMLEKIPVLGKSSMRMWGKCGERHRLMLCPQAALHLNLLLFSGTFLGWSDPHSNAVFRVES